MKNWFKHINNISLALIFLSALLFPIWTPLFFVLYFLGVNFTYQNFEKYLTRGVNIFSITMALGVFISYFISLDKEIALNTILAFLPLFVIPVVLAFQSKHLDFKVYIWIFIISLFLVGIVEQLLNLSAGASLLTLQDTRLIETNIYQMFMCTGVVFVLNYKLTRYTFGIQGGMILVLSLFILQHQNGVGMYTLFIILFIWMIKQLIKYLKWGPTLILFGAIIAISVYMIQPSNLYNNVITLKESFSTNQINSKGQSTFYKEWHAGSELIKESPYLGYGVGDAQHVFIKKLYQLGYDDVAKEARSISNQFMSTGIQIGIGGIIAYCLLIISIFYSAVRHKSWNFFYLGLIIFVNSFFTTILERPEGIYYFCIVILLFYKIGLYDRLKTSEY